MTVTLPTTPGMASYRIFPVTAGGVEESALGGAAILINRPGDKWGIEVELPPMAAGQIALNWCAALNYGRRQGVLMNWPQNGLSIGTPGSPLVNGANQSGSSLNIDGASASHVFPSGQFFSVSQSGRTYLHQLFGPAVMNGSGAGTCTLVNPLRAIFADNGIIDFAVPKIQGYLIGDPGDWTVNRARHYGLRFTVVEQ